MKNKSFRKEYLREFYKNNKFNMLFAIFLAILLSILSVLVAILLQQIIDIATTGLMDNFIKVLIMSGAFFVILTIVYTLNNVYFPRYIHKALRQYKEKAIKNIFNKDIESFNKIGASKYINALTNDINSIEVKYLENILDLVSNIVMFIGALGIMLYYNTQMTLIAILFSLFPIVLTLLLGNKLGKFEQEVSNKNSSYLHFLKDTLNGFSVIKSFNAEDKINDLLNEKNDELEKNKERRRVAVEQIKMVGGIASIISQFAIFLYGAYLAVKGDAITPGVIILFLQQMNYIVNPIAKVPQVISQRRSMLPLIDDLANATIDLESHEDRIKDVTFEESIEVKDLSYAYDNHQVLKNVNFKFDKNKSYALVGQSGSGKSTLLKLISGTLNNYQGEIDFDGKPLKSLDKDNFNKLLSVIEQNVFIFDSTINDNITMYSDFDSIRINDVIHKSGLDKVIEEKGKDYRCGESGSGLSGGEKQRVAIARGLLRDAKLLLIDEATSALDNETSVFISNQILSLNNLTKIVVTHRLEESILRKYDEIIVLNNGEIVENGTFEELVSKNSYFKSMYLLQTT